VPKSGWAATLTFLSLIGTMCVAFALISIRRRFKLD
jgi:LPXTG-motif cell wall-anchored protein